MLGGWSEVGLETFTPEGEVLWYNCFPLCESSTWQVWDLILLWLCPSSHFIVDFSLDVGYHFGTF